MLVHFQIGATSSSSGPVDLDTSDERLLASQLADDLLLEGEVVSSQTITSQSRTVETTTYTAERNGECETRVEQKVTIQSDGEPIDHDEALAQAIQEATAMNPDNGSTTAGTKKVAAKKGKKAPAKAKKPPVKSWLRRLRPRK